MGGRDGGGRDQEGTLVIARSGDPNVGRRLRRQGWTPATIAVAEALLVGVPAKWKDAVEGTGLSNGPAEEP